MLKTTIFIFGFILLYAIIATGQMIVKDSGQNQVAVITESGRLGIGTEPDTEPLGALEIRTDNLRRFYEHEGTLHLSRGLKDASVINNPHHYVKLDGSGWDANSGMYWSSFTVPGAIAHIYNRNGISGPAGNNNTHWQINSGAYLPKHMVVFINDNYINFHQPHVAASNSQVGPQQFSLNLTNGNMSIGGQAYKPGGGSWQASSDARLKDIKGSYDHGLAEILQLQPVRYSYKKDNARHHAHDVEHVGFVAQDVETIFPEAVSVGEDGFLNFDMHAINVALVNAVKEQQSQIEELKAENARLTARITEFTELRYEIETIKSVLNTSLNDVRTVLKTDK